MYYAKAVKTTKIYFYTVFIVFIGLITFLAYLDTQEKSVQTYTHNDVKIKVISPTHKESLKVIDKIETPEIRIKKYKGKTSVSAYTARVEECDGDPTTTASGKKVREGIVAMNGVPFGTKIEIEGVGIFEVQDRMTKKNNGKIDIFMWNLNKAKKFGKKTLNYYFLK